MPIPSTDPRIACFAPQPVDRTRAEVRLERFPPHVATALAGQIGALANLRSSSGCAVGVRTDSPWVDLHLDRLRHHQLVPVGVAAEIAGDDGWHATHSGDLREREGAVAVRLATGLERGGPPREVWMWLPVISTAVVAGVGVADGSVVEAPSPPRPRWLAIGDSLTQGFTVQSPLHTWVHRLSRRWDLPAWNLGVGGLRIEPEAVRWALAARPWDLVTIALGSNHAWREADVAMVAERAAEVAHLAASGGHGRVVWIIPPWKPCEDGKGPADFAGVPLDRAAGERARRIRGILRETLAPFAPRIDLVGDLLPEDARYYPDGLHPFAIGFARFADGLARHFGPGVGPGPDEGTGPAIPGPLTSA